MPDMPKSNPIVEGLPSLQRSPAAYPLDECYVREGRKIPQVEVIIGIGMPEPYKTLLVHNSDMTSTLERFYGDRIHLQVLKTWRKGESYFREVALLLNKTNKPVEFGAIKINLALFDAGACQLILEGHLPLGRVLNDHAIAYHSNPKSFLKIEADDFIGKALQLGDHPSLYGRRNTLSNPQGGALAEIVEILPP
jgi:chorismate-pyruvate lyase